MPVAARFFALCVALAPGIAACGGRPSFTGVDVSTGQSLSHAPGRMAPGHSFAGVYWSPQSGRLYLAQHENRLEGQYDYRVCACAVRGWVSGTVDGNLADLVFHERFLACPGTRDLSGRGYLFYQAVPLSQEPARLFGARAYLVATPAVASRGGGGEERGRATWTAVEVDPKTPLALSDQEHCP